MAIYEHLISNLDPLKVITVTSDLPEENDFIRISVKFDTDNELSKNLVIKCKKMSSGKTV